MKKKKKVRTAGAPTSRKFASQEALDAYIKKQADQKARRAAARAAREKGTRRSSSRTSPLAGHRSSIAVGDDAVEPWRRRAVDVFSAVALEKDDRAASIHELGRIQREVREMSAKQRRDEDRQALEILKGGGLSPVAVRRAMSTLTQGAGEALLPKPFLAEVFVITEQYGIVRQQFRSVMMVSRDLDLKSIATKPTIGFVDELGVIGDSDLVFDDDQVLKTYKGGGISSWSTELDEDEAIEMLPILTQLYGEGFAQWEDEVGFIADGSGSYKTQTGMLLAAGNTYTMASTMTSFKDLTADDLSKARLMASTSSRRGARWFMHPTIVGIVERLKDDQGQYLYRAPGDAGRPGTLWGDPVVEVEGMPNDGDDAVDTPFITYGNPVHALFGQRRGVTVTYSTDAILHNSGTGVVEFNAFSQDGALIRLLERVGVIIPTPNVDRFVSIVTAAS